MQYQEVTGSFCRGTQAADLEKKQQRDVSTLSELKTLVDWSEFRIEFNKIEKILKGPYILDFTVEKREMLFSLCEKNPGRHLTAGRKNEPDRGK